MSDGFASERFAREVVLDELILRFDAPMVEVCVAARYHSDRFHVAQLERVQLLRLDNRRGPTLHQRNAEWRESFH